MTGRRSAPHVVKGLDYPAPWVSHGDPLELRERARQWLTTPALRTLLSAFGSELDVATDVAALRQWSAQSLDSRDGRERHHAQVIDYTPAQLDALRGAAGPLGLMRTAPATREKYVLTVVLGGTVTGNNIRAQLAFNLRRLGLDLGTIAGSAASRQLSTEEQALVAATTTDADVPPTEYEHLASVLAQQTSATQRSLIKTDEADDPFASSAVENLTRDAEPVGYLLRAPSRRPGRRADTLDAVHFARQELGAAGGTLVITSAIYAPYTYFLLAALSTQHQPIEVLGTPTLEAGTARQAQRFAQEIHATLMTLPL